MKNVGTMPGISRMMREVPITDPCRIDGYILPEATYFIKHAHNTALYTGVWEAKIAAFSLFILVFSFSLFVKSVTQFSVSI